MISTNKQNYERLDKLSNKIKQVTGVDIKGTKQRHRHIINAKKIYYHVARNKGITFAEIGSFIGSDHATALFHYKDLPNLMKYDKQLHNDFLRVTFGVPENNDRDLFELKILQYM